VAGIFFSLLAFFSIHIFWRISVNRTWEERKKRYKEKLTFKKFNKHDQ